MSGITGQEPELHNYQRHAAPYDTPEGRAAAPQWLRDKAAAATAAAPEPERFPEARVATAVPKNAVLYAILGLIIPGLPSLLIRDDKVLGAIQLGIWLLSWVGILFLIGFLIWPAVATWSAITGYGDAQLWNRRHGFVT